jgi:hypothetical protein
MRAPPKATSFLLEHVPKQEGGSSRLPQRCSAPSHHSELPQPTAVTLPKTSKPPVVCPFPWPSVLAPVRVIAQPLSRRRQWASTKWAPETLQGRLTGVLIPHQPWRRAAPCCAGSTAAVGSRVCDFACSTDSGVELPTSRTRPVPTSDAELPLSLAVKEQVSSRGRPPPLPWSCAVAGHPSAVLSRSVRICCLQRGIVHLSVAFRRQRRWRQRRCA